jgi:putative transposase
LGNSRSSWIGLKKSLNVSHEQKRLWIEPGEEQIPVYRQCELAGVSRSVYYYHPQPESEVNQQVMRLIDEEYTRHPFYGGRRLTVWLRHQGYPVNLKRVRRFMRLMGLEALTPRPHLSRGAACQEKYPYLLHDLVIAHPDQVWCTDITYIRMVQGFVYLVAMMDWYSRYVVSWNLSTTLETAFCLEALHQALTYAIPKIFNSDQGAQFTSREFTGCLKAAEIAISMDGRGRVYDNIFIERLWRSVKYEEVYLNDYETVKEARTGLERYFAYYNTARPHQALNYDTPADVYFQEHSQRHLNLSHFLS